MKEYVGYIIAFILGIMVVLIWPDGEPKVVVDSKLQESEINLQIAVDSLQKLVIEKETTIDSIKVELIADSVIINSKKVDRHEEVTFINRATVSDDFRWLSNRY